MQLGDLRSAIIKDACAAIEKLSAVMGDSFGSYADVVLPKLINLTPVTVSVISETAHHCLLTLIKNTQITTLPLLISSATQSKHATTRCRCVEYVGVFVFHRPNSNVLKRSFQEVQDMILNAVRDAALPTRQAARTCYWNFQARFPNEAKVILENLDAKTAAMIMRDEKKTPSTDAQETETKAK